MQFFKGSVAPPALEHRTREKAWKLCNYALMWMKVFQSGVKIQCMTGFKRGEVTGRCRDFYNEGDSHFVGSCYFKCIP
jgi:hypothetical protein